MDEILTIIALILIIVLCVFMIINIAQNMRRIKEKKIRVLEGTILKSDGLYHKTIPDQNGILHDWAYDSEGWLIEVDGIPVSEGPDTSKTLP